MSGKDQQIRRDWAIFNPRTGLYTGTAPTRSEAIAQHVWAFDRELFDAGYPTYCRALNDKQRACWKERRKHGDAAVRVIVATEAPA